MKSLREQAISLRIEGKSYNEILATIGVPKSTLSSWQRNVSIHESDKVY
jgi:transposase